MTSLSCEQKKIIAAPLRPLCVVACAGSGKTRTAIHRLAEIRKRLADSRGRAVLLSFSNVAVNTFRRDYSQLTNAVGMSGGARSVEIDTIDAFVTANVLRPHSYRTMGSSVAAFLVTGSETFLQGYKFQAANFPQPITQLQVGFRNGQPHFYCSFHEQVTPIDLGVASDLVARLGRTGAYTHSIGRYWCYQTLQQQPGILRALARRYPHILIDEAQDIGTMHQALLELLARAGVQVSLIGDPNQGIYEFAGADGTYLTDYSKRDGIGQYGLTRNYRSVPSILTLANKLAGRTDSPDRSPPATSNGGYFLSYRNDQRQHLVEAFRQAIENAGLQKSNSAIVCRARKLADDLAGGDAPVGQGTPKIFAEAAVLRDKHRDYDGSFRATTIALAGLLANPPRDFLTRMVQPARFPETRAIRRDIWTFARNCETGLPSAILIADIQWHPLLVARVKEFLAVLKAKYDLASVDTIGQKLSKKNLPNTALMITPDLATIQAEPLRCDTVHQVKGESLDAVLYIASKEHARALLAGVNSELGRIGYVALTRARNLFWLAVPANCIGELRPALIALGLQEAGTQSNS